jgi:hypothetical protein
MSANHDDADEKVGFCSPPKRTRFEKGNRANPWGRKGKPQLAAPFDPNQAIAAFFAQRIELKLNGKRRKMSIFEAQLHVLQAQAMKGNMTASKLLFSIATKFDLAATSAAMAREAVEKEERVLQDALREMMLLFAADSSPKRKRGSPR